MYHPQALLPLSVVIGILSLASFPIIGLVFLDRDSKVSVSQYGIPLMGFTDVIKYAVFAIGFSGYYYGARAEASDYIVICSIFLAIAIWILCWFAAPRNLPPHYTYFRLRWRGQIRLLAHQRAWIVASGVMFLDAFAFTLLVGSIFGLWGMYDRLIGASHWLIYASSAVWVAVMCVVLSSKIGTRAGIKLYHICAYIPFYTVAQMACIAYGTPALVDVAVSVFNFGIFRTALMGVMMLHTLPSRETLLLTQAVQVIAGCLGIILGISSGYLILSTSWGHPKPILMGIMAIYELIRLPCVAMFLRFHTKENIATP